MSWGHLMLQFKLILPFLIKKYINQEPGMCP